MNYVEALLHSKWHGGMIRFKKQPILLYSIYYSPYYSLSCNYFQFSNDGDTLLCYGLFDLNTIYFIGWKYMYRQLLIPKYIIGKIEIHQDVNWDEQRKDLHFSLFQELDDRMWCSIVEENHSEATYAISLFTSQTNDILSFSTNIQIPKKNSFKRMDCCRFSVTGCSLVLPSVSTIHYILYFSHPNIPIAEDEKQQFARIGMKRRLQSERIISEWKSYKIHFFNKKERMEWIMEESVDDVQLSKNTILPNSIHSENHDFHHVNTNRQIQSILINYNTILTSLFSNYTIHYVNYSLLSSFLCSSICPFSHSIFCFSVLLSPKHSQYQHEIQLYIVVIEFNLHDEYYYSSKETPTISQAASYSILFMKCCKKWLNQHSFSIMKLQKVADTVLRQYGQFIREKQTTTDFGKPYYYSSQNNSKYIVNTKYEEILVNME